MVFLCDLDYRRLLCNCFGHNRDKNDSGFVSPVKAKIDGFAACMQWLVFGLYWSGDEGLICLTNLVCLGTTQIELEDWLSSPQPLNIIGREVNA